jgi:hypothetical protein
VNAQTNNDSWGKKKHRMQEKMNNVMQKVEVKLLVIKREKHWEAIGNFYKALMRKKAITLGQGRDGILAVRPNQFKNLHSLRV